MKDEDLKIGDLKINDLKIIVGSFLQFCLCIKKCFT